MSMAGLLTEDERYMGNHALTLKLLLGRDTYPIFSISRSKSQGHTEFRGTGMYNPLSGKSISSHMSKLELSGIKSTIL